MFFVYLSFILISLLSLRNPSLSHVFNVDVNLWIVLRVLENLILELFSITVDSDEWITMIPVVHVGHLPHTEIEFAQPLHVVFELVVALKLRWDSHLSLEQA